MDFDTSELNSYITNEDLEASIGVWIKFQGGVRLRCLRAGGSNRKYARALQAAIRPHKRQVDRGTLDDEVSNDILRDVYAKHVVKDWEGVKTTDGQEVPYAPSACVEFFRAVPELFNELVTVASEMSTFAEDRVKEAEEALGN